MKSHPLTPSSSPTEDRKPEVLRLMTSVLNYTAEELQELNTRHKDSGWLTNLFKQQQQQGGGDQTLPSGQVSENSRFP